MTSSERNDLIQRSARWGGPIHVGLSIVGAGILGVLILNFPATGSDTRSYWGFSLVDPYAEAMGNLSAEIAFRYAPPVALALAPFSSLPYPLFHLLWFTGTLAALVFVTRAWVLAAMAIYPVVLEVSVGNIHLLLVAIVIAGLRWPVLWALLPLTKVTPGVLFLWFAFRREWNNLAIALLATSALALISWAIAPGLWSQWFTMLESNFGAPAGIAVPVPLWLRLPAAAAILAWGARSNRRWTLPVALLMSMPTMWPHSFAVLVAIALYLPILHRDRRRPNAVSVDGS